MPYTERDADARPHRVFRAFRAAVVAGLLWRRHGRAGTAVTCRWLPDVLAAMATTTVVARAGSGHPLGPLWGLGPLLAIGVWAAIRAQRALAASRHLPVRVGADIALALLLGGTLAVALAWAANRLGLPPARFDALRQAVKDTGALLDVPWYVWLTLYVLLAAAAWVTLPLRRAGSAFRLLVPTTRVVAFGGRALSVTHTVLLIVSLVGAVAPAAIDGKLRGPARVRYAIVEQRDRTAVGTRAAYAEIIDQFATGPHGQARHPHQFATLDVMVRRIHAIDPPDDATGDAPQYAREVARRLGRLQARTVTDHVRATHPPAFHAITPARDPDASRPYARVRHLDQVDARAHAHTARARLFSLLAAKAVASALTIPDVGDNEAVQLLHEYVVGLVEDGPLRNVFTEWADRRSPPRGDLARTVVPDGDRLRTAALNALRGQNARATTDSPMRVPDGPAAAQAADLANESRYLVNKTGPHPPYPPPAHHDKPHARKAPKQAAPDPEIPQPEPPPELYLPDLPRYPLMPAPYDPGYPGDPGGPGDPGDPAVPRVPVEPPAPIPRPPPEPVRPPVEPRIPFF